MKNLSVWISLSAWLLSSSVALASDTKLIQVILDDTGALQDSNDPHEKGTAREAMTRYLQSVAPKYGKDSKVIVISLYGIQNVWTGEAKDIKSSNRNTELVKFMRAKWGGCSDLTRVHKLLRDNLYLHPAKESVVVFFSSLIHTGQSCSAKNFKSKNKLPGQYLPSLLKFQKEFSAEVSFLWVYTDSQSEIRSELVQFLRDNVIPGTVKVEAETRSESFK